MNGLKRFCFKLVEGGGEKGRHFVQQGVRDILLGVEKKPESS